MVLCGLVGDDFPAPSADPIDLIAFEDGSKLSYDAEAGELVLELAGKMRIVAPDGLAIEGDVDVTGTITASEDAVADGISLKSHTHGGVQAGGASTGAPQ